MIPFKKKETSVQVSIPLGNLCWPLSHFTQFHCTPQTHRLIWGPCIFAPQITHITSVTGLTMLYYDLLLPWRILSGRVWGLWDQGLLVWKIYLFSNPSTRQELNKWTKWSSKLLFLKHSMYELGWGGRVVIKQKNIATVASRFLSAVYSSWKVNCFSSYFKWKVLYDLETKTIPDLAHAWDLQMKGRYMGI